MFLRLLKGSLFRQKSKMLMIAFTVALGVSLATAMLNVMFDVGDKVNYELKAYGSNITVLPKNTSILKDIYGDLSTTNQYLKESELYKLKTIFWAFNIVDFAPILEVDVKDINHNNFKIIGTWFDKNLNLPTGEKFQTGIKRLKSWWSIEGIYLNDDDDFGVIVGSNIADTLKLKLGDELSLFGKNKVNRVYKVKAILKAGGVEDNQLFVTLKSAQYLNQTIDTVSSIDVSALTTPDNELAKKAAKNIQSLSLSEMETWYCTAYVSSICYQIEEVISNAIAKPVRAVAQSEGAILDKTKLLMILITILSLVGSILGISNLVTTSVMERSKEIGLLKAIGAHNYQVTLLVLSNIIFTSLLGGISGYFIGIFFAHIIGISVFGSSISANPTVIPIIIVLVIFVSLIGSIPAIRMLLKLHPAIVLRGGH